MKTYITFIVLSKDKQIVYSIVKDREKNFYSHQSNSFLTSQKVLELYSTQTEHDILLKGKFSVGWLQNYIFLL